MESASPFVAKIMKKQIDLENVKQILKDSYNSGIKASINIITGFPGEQEKHHIESLEFVKQIIKYLSSIHISPCQIYEGSQLALYPEKYNLDKNDMFPGKWKIFADNNTEEIYYKRVKDFVEIVNFA